MPAKPSPQLSDVIDVSTGEPREGWTEIGKGVFAKPAESYAEKLGYSAPAPDAHRRKGRVRLS